MDQMIAKRKEPKASEPKLYLKANQMPLEREKSPLLLYVLEKYQVQTPTIIMNENMAERSSEIQNSPNT
jgi:hypothetical protein